MWNCSLHIVIVRCYTLQFVLNSTTGLLVYTLIKGIGLNGGTLTRVDYVSLDDTVLASSTLQVTSEAEVFIAEEPIIVPNVTFVLQVKKNKIS